jgi:hypothetical protein
MFALLTALRDRALTQQWGVWLAGKDTDRALKVGHRSFRHLSDEIHFGWNSFRSY